MNSLKFWTTDGFDVASYKWKLEERVNKQFNGSGSDNTGLCTYSYNELGFRGDSIHKNGFRIMSIGCSLTEGVGVNDNETWPSYFSQLIPNSVDLNFGFSGRSNDYISRCLLTYYDLIKPDLVLIMYTFPARREIFTKDGGVEPFIPSSSWGYLKETQEGVQVQHMLFNLQNNNEDFVNWYKNHLLIKYFLETKKCNWLWNGWMGIDKNYNEFNRFDGGYGGRFIDLGVDGLHPGPKHNKEYSTNLYNYIMKNFRNYLPDNIIIDRNLI